MPEKEVTLKMIFEELDNLRKEMEESVFPLTGVLFKEYKDKKQAKEDYDARKREG